MRVVLFCLGLSVAIFGVFAPGTVLSQDAGVTAAPDSAAIDYEIWESEAGRAENLVGAGTASTAFLENLRTTLVGWRARFLAAQSANSARIETIQAQISALGPAPAEGEIQPAEIAQRREDLNQRLAEAQLPRVNATEAFNRADGLIAEIDAILAERQTQELLELDPTPLNPMNWTTVLTALSDLAGEIYFDTVDRTSDQDLRDQARDGFGRIALIGVLGLLLFLRGRTQVIRLGEKYLRDTQKNGRTALAYLVSIGQFVLPAIGISLVMLALSTTGMAGEKLTLLVLSGLGLILSVFYAVWIGGRLFPADPERPAAFDAQAQDRRPARSAVWWIGLFMGLATVAQTIANFDTMPPSTRGVLVLPVYVGLGYGFWRLARAILPITRAADQDAGPGFAHRVAAFMARAVILVAVLGPLLAAIGYLNAAEQVMIPTALTLSVLGVLLSLQPVIRDLYALIFRTSEGAARDALTPILVNFALVFAALPIVALAWGVRADRLGELYARFFQGFSLGDTRITPFTVLAVVLVFGGGILVTRLLQGALKSTVLPRTSMDVGARNAVTSGVGYVGIALAAIIAVTSAGIDLTALGFVLGALSVGIGFGLQNVVSNFVSGIILLIERPISEGDWIEVNGNMGIVKAISVRSTRIETFDKTDVIVPNADFISGTVTNWTRGNTIGRAVVTVGVAYGNDTRRVQEILLEIAHNHPVIATFPEPGVDFLGFGADSLDFRVRAILRDVNQLVAVKTELNHQIAERFKQEGIEIPFAQRDIWLRNPEALAGAAPLAQRVHDTAAPDAETPQDLDPGGPDESKPQ